MYRIWLEAVGTLLNVFSYDAASDQDSNQSPSRLRADALCKEPRSRVTTRIIYMINKFKSLQLVLWCNSLTHFLHNRNFQKLCCQTSKIEEGNPQGKDYNNKLLKNSTTTLKTLKWLCRIIMLMFVVGWPRGSKREKKIYDFMYIPNVDKQYYSIFEFKLGV